jgi:hypothetical protein
MEAEMSGSEELSVASERFSNLSSGLMGVLADLSRIIRTSAEELGAIQSAVDLKKSELKRLHDIDVAAETLERLLESQRKQKENFEAQMESDRRAWEEEKTRRSQEREQEENAYAESLKMRRRSEEEEYKLTWELEKAHAQQQLEEELRLIQQESRLKQEAVEKNCMQRELALKEKELEWAQLVQELEQFMSKLTRRAQSRFADPLDSPMAEDLPQTAGSGEEQGNYEANAPQSEESQPSAHY